MIEHGPSYRPYDCNLCAKKFYFRAELENHLIDHENGRITTPTMSNKPNQADTNSSASNEPKPMQMHFKHEHDKTSNEDSDSEKDKDSDVQHQNLRETNAGAAATASTAADDDDEYIEVEQIGESSTVNHESRTGIDTHQSESNDKYDEND